MQPYLVKTGNFTTNFTQTFTYLAGAPVQFTFLPHGNNDQQQAS